MLCLIFFGVVQSMSEKSDGDSRIFIKHELYKFFFGMRAGRRETTGCEAGRKETAGCEVLEASTAGGREQHEQRMGNVLFENIEVCLLLFFKSFYCL